MNCIICKDEIIKGKNLYAIINNSKYICSDNCYEKWKTEQRKKDYEKLLDVISNYENDIKEENYIVNNDQPENKTDSVENQLKEECSTDKAMITKKKSSRKKVEK